MIQKIESANKKAEEAIRLEQERVKQAQILEEKKKKRAKIRLVTFLLLIGLIGGMTILSVYVIIPNRRYNTAKELMNKGYYAEAIVLFEEHNKYKDSSYQAMMAKYNWAITLMNNKDYEDAMYHYCQKETRRIEAGFL